MADQRSTPAPADSTVSEWQREVRYTYWHEPSNLILEVAELAGKSRWQIVEYWGDTSDSLGQWKVIAQGSVPLDTVEEAQAAALAWLDTPDREGEE